MYSDIGINRKIWESFHSWWPIYIPKKGYWTLFYREFNLNPNLWETKTNREKTNAKEKKKTITHTRQYLRGLAICLRPRSYKDFTIIREEYRIQDAATIFSLTLKHGNTTHNKNLITQSRFLYKNGPKKISRGLCPQTPKRLVHKRSDLGLSAQASAPWTKPQ